ncbi:MAG: tetratricopeptide repeat protein [Polyangiaceae bacterium]|nr:tetratricopeptide repeat protein [Polyangiaceae bacterium]
MAARSALTRFDLEAASRHLAQHARLDPDDRQGSALRETALRLSAAREVAAGARSELEAVLALQAHVPDELRAAWHRRVAELAEADGAGAARVAGEPVGAHWLAGGEPARALESLQASLAHAPGDARVRALAADALYASGQVEPARREYQRAFVDGPGDIALERVADATVSGLVELARDPYELPEPAVEWVPAVGVVERVFPLPQPPLPGVLAEPALRPPLEWLALIARERSARALDDRVEIRRRMKQLAPLLFEAYLGAFA